MTIHELGHFSTAFLFTVVFLLSGTKACVIPENTSHQGQSKEAVLKVKTIASQTCYPRGEIADIILYEDMEAEFDFYPPNTPERVGMEFKAERRKAKLTAADFEKFIELINQPDLLDAKKTYSPRRISPMSVDSEVKKIVTLRRGTQEKEIILEEGECRLYLDGAPSYVVAKSELYPVSLVKLLKFVDSVNIDMRKQIDPNSR